MRKTAVVALRFVGREHQVDIASGDSSPRWCLEHPSPSAGMSTPLLRVMVSMVFSSRWVRWREQDWPQSCGGQRRRVRVAARHFTTDPHREAPRPKSGSGEDERGVA